MNKDFMRIYKEDSGWAAEIRGWSTYHAPTLADLLEVVAKQLAESGLNLMADFIADEEITEEEPDDGTG